MSIAEPQIVALFGNETFVDVNQMPGVLIRPCEDTETQKEREGGHGKVEADVGVRLREAKEGPGWLGTPALG